MKRNGSVNSSFSETAYCIAVDNNNNVFVAGINDASDGIIIKYVQAPIGIQQNGNELPKDFELGQNYPNPFNPNTQIDFSIPKSSLVTIKIFDVLGKEVAEVVKKDLTAGSYTFDFNASSLTSGVYFYQLTAGEFTDTKKLVLVK